MLRKKIPADSNAVRQEMTDHSPVDDSVGLAPVRPRDPRQLDRLVRDAFAGYAGGSGHPCLGSRSVVHDDSYQLQILRHLGTRASARRLEEGLESFRQQPAYHDASFSSFVAVFREPAGLSGEDFHRLLWRQLQLLHDLDRQAHAWDPSVSSDPEDPNFSFSVASEAYFVIGLNPSSPRWARRFSWPTLVFNPHRQFATLQADGKFSRMRSMIRDRDSLLQGDENPALADFGETSEARQYSGLDLPPGWRCPLRVRQ